ncbi:hypothetical protein OIU84_005224 [Salix udensis]|uniref:Uncharacterized protein n=1 Tax=Salix udensis TaxID=889485 RepID=A0AAD6P0J1_9ROSI|nr:hypothetical protein OIU84_005224 [Salix udensis]
MNEQVPPGLESSARTTTTTMNKGKIYISKSSSHGVLEAYSLQFQTDFSSFLKSRSKEIAAGGCMLLSLMGRRSPDPTTDDSCYHWELLAQALMSMVSEGLVEEEKVDSFNAPYYGPCVEEIKMEIEKEGSFIVSRLETFEIEWDGGCRRCGHHIRCPVTWTESGQDNQSRDLGCSRSGPNSLSLISEIIDMIYAECRDLGRPTPELKVFLAMTSILFLGSLPAFYDELRKEKGFGVRTMLCISNAGRVLSMADCFLAGACIACTLLLVSTGSCISIFIYEEHFKVSSPNTGW